MNVWFTSYDLDRINRLLETYKVRTTTQFVEKAVIEVLERLEGEVNENTQS